MQGLAAFRLPRQGLIAQPFSLRGIAGAMALHRGFDELLNGKFGHISGPKI